MAKLIGAVTALAALAVCILAGIDPVLTTVRGMVAYAVGHVVGAVWEGLLKKPQPRVVEMTATTNGQTPSEDPDAQAA